MFPVEDEVVPIETQVAGDLATEEGEGEDVAVLSSDITRSGQLVRHETETDVLSISGGMMITLARYFSKKLTGSVPYAIALPMYGIQWKTAGGSVLGRKNN